MTVSKNVAGKHLLALVAVCFLHQLASAQYLMEMHKTDYVSSKGTYFPERLLLNPQLPDITVYTEDGKPAPLRHYVSQNRKKPKKPFLLVTTYTFCGGCVDLLKMLDEQDITKQYDVFVVLELMDAELEPNDKRRSGFFSKTKVLSLKESVNFVYAKQTETQRELFGGATPLYMVCDSEGRPIYSKIDLTIAGLAPVVNALRLADQGKASRQMIWLDKEGAPVAKESAKADAYYSIVEEGNRGVFTYGQKDFVAYKLEFLRRNDYLLFDGVFQTNASVQNEDGTRKVQSLINTRFSNGYPVEPYRTYNADGSLLSENLINGTYRQYDQNGKLSLTGNLKRGVGEGEFRYLRNDTLIKTVYFVDGALKGPLREYKNGKLVLSAEVNGEVYTGLYQSYNEKGELSCERYLLPDVESTSCLADGLSLIQRDGLYGYIDIKGRVIIAPKFTRAFDFKNGKAHVYIDKEDFYIDKQGKKVSD